MDTVEFFSLLGYPARLAGRGLLSWRYAVNRGRSSSEEYAKARFGKSIRWRPWLMIDVVELEETERLINDSTDAQIESWRMSKLSICGMIAIIGALVSSVGVTALQLPGLKDCHFVARGCFVMSLILSLLSVFFSGLQNTSFGRQVGSNDLRLWLSSGWYTEHTNHTRRLRSSIVAHMILEAPFEVVVMSITLFIVGLGTYLGSSWKYDLALSVGYQGNRGVLIAFIIPTVFVLLMYSHMLGLKDIELLKTDNARRRASVIEHPAPIKTPPDDLEASKAFHISTQPVQSDLTALRDALQAAAEAQRRCAEAATAASKQYERLLDQALQ